MLLAIAEALQKEKAIADFPGVRGDFDGKQLLHAPSNAVPYRDGIQLRTRVYGLVLNPFSRARRILVFQPAIGIGDLDAMPNLSYRF